MLVNWISSVLFLSKMCICIKQANRQSAFNFNVCSIWTGELGWKTSTATLALTLSECIREHAVCGMGYCWCFYYLDSGWWHCHQALPENAFKPRMYNKLWGEEGFAVWHWYMDFIWLVVGRLVVVNFKFIFHTISHILWLGIISPGKYICFLDAPNQIQCFFLSSSTEFVTNL